MRAFYMESYGGPEVMTLGELPEPMPGKKQVLIAVKAAAINPLDWKIRQGMIKLISGFKFPRTLGSDFSGIIARLGPEVKGWEVGEPVYSSTRMFLGKPGALSERLVISARQLRRKPTFLSFVDAASLPVAALTALNGLRLCGDLSGKTVLVNGATGGVGHFAVQIARTRGATVTAVCSTGNMEFARSLGASRVIDYTHTDFTQSGERYEVIFDAYGKMKFATARRALAPRGYFASTLLATPALIGAMLWHKLIGGQQIVAANMRARAEDFEALEQLLESGVVRPVIGQLFPLNQAAEAFKAFEAGGIKGKVVIRIQG